MREKGLKIRPLLASIAVLEGLPMVELSEERRDGIRGGVVDFQNPFDQPRRSWTTG